MSDRGIPTHKRLAMGKPMGNGMKSGGKVAEPTAKGKGSPSQAKSTPPWIKKK